MAANPFLYEPQNGNSSDSSEHSGSTFRNVDHIINGKEGKMFVGGLSWVSTVESLRAYFEQFGELEDCIIMRDAKTKMTRGFGFVTFLNPMDIHKVLAVPSHYLDGKKIDPQIAIRHISPARSVNNICRKVFIGGVPQNCDVEDIKQHFSQFGQVEDAVLKMDYPKKQHRGFGFITFVQSEIADLVCSIRFHNIQGKPVECKKAQKKEFVKLNDDAQAAAAQMLSHMPQEQVFALYSMFVNKMCALNPMPIPPVPLVQPEPPVLSPASSQSMDEFVDPHMTDFRRRIVLKYLNQIPQNQ